MLNGWFPGPPQEMQRPRITKGRSQRGMRNTPAVNSAKNVIALQAQAMRNIPVQTGPVTVSITYILPIPASWDKWKKRAALDGTLKAQRKPDLDNLLKLTLDALNGVWWFDDGQVVSITARKAYGDDVGTHVVAVFDPEISKMSDLPKTSPADSGQ